MDFIGFLRVLQGNLTIMATLLLIILACYLLIRFLIAKTLEDTKLNREARRVLKRVCLILGACAVIFELLLVTGLMLSNRLPRADVDKAGSGVYRQMEDLQRKAQ